MKKIQTKKILSRVLSLVLALLMLLCLAACGGTQPVLELQGEQLSVGVYRLMLSIQKGNMAYLIKYHYGDYDSPEFWNTIIKAPTVTNDSYYTAAIYNKAKNLISAAVLFDTMKLSLSDETMKSIDKEMDGFVDEFGGGSKKAFNAVLDGYGFDYDDLKEYKIMNAKAEQAANELYGKKGDKIGAELKQEYLEEHYYAFRQIFIANFYNVYKTDANGDMIYYDGNGNVAYDTVSGVPQMGEDGKLVYYKEDGRIAYDTKSGKPSPELDEDGYQKTEEYTHEEWLERIQLAADIMEDCENGDDKQFELLASEYSNDSVSANLTVYVADNVNYESMGDSESYVFLNTATEKLAEMKVGDIDLIQDESGLHIIRKYELEQGAYSNDSYAGWFKDSSYGVYDFNSNLKNDLFTQVLSEYHEDISTDEELLDKYTLSTALPNYHYH